MDGINESVLTFLLNATWQITVVVLAASACARLLRAAPARYRHALWVSVLLLGVALPVWSHYNFSVDSTETLSTPPATATSPRESDAPAALTAPSGQTDDSNAPRESVFQLETLLHRRSRTLSGMPSIMFVIVFAYALFLLYRLNALRRAWKRTQKIRRAVYVRAIPFEMKEVAARCGALFKLQDVRIRCSTLIEAPVTIGWRKPIIILPESFFDGDLPSETLLSVLGHEMAHIARRDFAFNIFYEFLRLPVSFHPLALLVMRQINRTRELACDELVAGRVLAADAYARSLVRVASTLTTPAGHAYSLGSLGVFDADILEERVMRLIEKRGRMSVRAGRLLMAASFSLLFTVTTLTTSVFSFNFRSAGNESELRQEQPAQADVAEKIRALSSADASERAAAACALGRRRAAQAIPSLIQMLGDDAAIEPVKCWDENADWNPALATFKQASPGEEAAIALAAMGQPAVEPLRGRLAN
jgi:beta-lactamase regulating signal transducer with metallopeptidase domain